MTEVKKAWKFLDLAAMNDGSDLIRSRSGDHTWTIGEWYHVKGTITACSNGFHCSDQIREAFAYVPGAVLAEVEVKGDCDDEGDKSAWSDMRITRAWKFGKADSVALAIFVAELVIGNYESAYPGDERPRKAIEAAKAYLADPSYETRSAARSAAVSAESAAVSARSAAVSTESAARSAAVSARSAARSAAVSARSAAESAVVSAAVSAAVSAESAAESAAMYAADSDAAALVDQIEEWLKGRLSSLAEFPA